MLSNKPYLLRAFNEWINDSACTPILVLDAMNPHCQFPAGYSEGGEIVFNISSRAIRDLKITNEYLEFRASFSGAVNLISAPMGAILAIYAEENGEGLYFDAEDDDSVMIPMARKQFTSIEGSAVQVSQETSSETAAKKKPILTIVE